MACLVYDKPITIQQQSSGLSQDAHGHVASATDASWETYTTAFAAVSSKGGREFWKADLVAADVSHIWRCPWDTTLAAATPKMRLQYDGTTYEVLSVIDVDLAHSEIEIQTRRAV